MNPTDQAIAGTHRIAHQMGARFSAPAERVEVECELSTMKFARSLDERHPYMRSSQAQFVEQVDPIRPSDWCLYVLFALVILACVAGAL